MVLKIGLMVNAKPTSFSCRASGQRAQNCDGRRGENAHLCLDKRRLGLKFDVCAKQTIANMTNDITDTNHNETLQPTITEPVLSIYWYQTGMDPFFDYK